MLPTHTLPTHAPPLQQQQQQPQPQQQQQQPQPPPPQPPPPSLPYAPQTAFGQPPRLELSPQEIQEMAAVAAVAAAAALRMPHMPLLSLPSLPSLPSGMPPASWSIGAPADLNPTLTARLAAASPGGVADLSVFSTVPVLAHLTGCSPQLGASPVASLPWASAGVGTAQGWAAAARAPAANAISVISAVPLFVPLPSDAATAAQADDEDDVVDVTEGHIAVVAAASLVQDD